MEEFFKIKKIEYLYDDIEFSNLQVMVNIHLEDNEKLYTNIIQRSINIVVLEVLLKTLEIPKHMIDRRFLKD